MSPADLSLLMLSFSGTYSQNSQKMRATNILFHDFKISNITFRETQSLIKAQKPDATFGEISKIVASMWDALGDEEKTVRAIN